MHFFFVSHGPPYGTERVRTGLLSATEVAKREDNAVKVLLTGDSRVSAAEGQ
ncbi:hypothetical protein [Streptomyces sp. NPDC127084]|uniref:hypothetical protein n=1 Tax=Streptomyces sp. NPDC127084 TaxID=3347133 RepID=UPI00364E04B1